MCDLYDEEQNTKEEEIRSTVTTTRSILPILL